MRRDTFAENIRLMILPEARAAKVELAWIVSRVANFRQIFHEHRYSTLGRIARFVSRKMIFLENIE
jgi:hypothetical protein